MIIEGSIPVTIDKLNLDLTLKTGQNFRWKQIENNEWIGVVSNNFVVVLEQNDREIRYRVLNATVQDHSCEFHEDILAEYFRLDVDIDHLYDEWNRSDRNFARISPKFRGIRLLRQCLVENIFSFICSSNNNVSRITNLVDKLCIHYGTVLHQSKDERIGTVYSFPSIEKLASDTIESELRTLGFGYRAKSIQQAAKSILKDGQSSQWLKNLRTMIYEDARDQLMTLPGIGPKVADCICLMSLDFTQSIPVDTHIFQITKKLYMPELPKGSLTTKRYNEIANFYRDKFKIHPGWAQTVLFCSDLKKQTKNESND